jgi:hypothetical protein
MQNLKIGATVLILDAQLRLHEGQKAQIISITDTKVVVEIHDVFRREAIELAPEQVVALDQIEPTTEGPFQTGDLVFLHKAGLWSQPLQFFKHGISPRIARIH